MSVRTKRTNSNTFYFITFTCYDWIELFEMTNIYDYIYKSFDILKTNKVYTTCYVIMPNHLHIIVFTKNTHERINDIIGNVKRFLAYEIIRRLKDLKKNDLLEFLKNAVSPNEKKKGKLHEVFMPSADIKELLTEKFLRQKLNYIHKNPISGKWKLVEEYTDYVHSSAAFYELGKKGIYDVIHYSEVFNED
ncbi:MAG: hypothetical protein WAT71_18095 [Ignavibacteria bacterium]